MNSLQAFIHRVGIKTIIFTIVIVIFFLISLVNYLSLRNDLLAHFDYVGGKLQWSPRLKDADHLLSPFLLLRKFQRWKEITLLAGIVLACHLAVALVRFFRHPPVIDEQDLTLPELDRPQGG